MPANSITLNFQKMPTVTVDGKTQKFKAGTVDGGYQPITEGGVTYSLVKDKESSRFTMTMSGEPTSLEKYNFSVGKGRVTDGKFGGDSMKGFFKGSVSLGEKKKAEKDYFQNFSIVGGHLADKASFLKSEAWGLDQTAAEKELNRLEEEAKKLAESKTEAKKDTEAKTESKPQPQVSNPAKKDQLDSAQKPNEPVPVPTPAILKEKAGKLLDKIAEAAQKKAPALLDNNPASTRLAKSISRFAEGLSLDFLKFADPKTEHLFLASADDYLTGLEPEVAALDQPSETSSDLIDQYPELFQSAVATVLEKEPSSISHLAAKDMFSSLAQDKQKQVLQFFNESLEQHLASLPNEGDQSSQSNLVEKSAELLKNLGLQRQVMPDDGNCFFFSLAANEQPSERARFSDQSTEANHQRQNLLETFSKLTVDQAQKSFPGQELFKTWEALESGLPTSEDYFSANDAQSGYKIDSAAWGNSSHLKLNAIRTGKPQVAIDAAANKIYVYHPSGSYKSVDAKHQNAKSDLQEFIKEKDAQIYESLPNHWNAARLATD